jgi:hypothetical protein
MNAGGPAAVADAPGRRDNQPDRPRAAPDNPHPGQLSGELLRPGIEGAQANGEHIRIPAPVRMMRSDEITAAAPDFASLGFIHRQSGGYLRSSAGSRAVPAARSG